MAQITLNSSGVASSGSLVLQSNGTTTAVTIDSSQCAAFVAGTAAAPAITTSGDTNTGLFFPAADTVGITTGGTERARVDSSGNLGLGVTPSAWGGGVKGFEFFGTGNALASGGANQILLMANAYYNSGWKYANSTYAPTYYQQNSGAHSWYNAASGTAGNAITFTQAMTLDASGNLFLGTTGITGGLSGQVFNLFGSGTVRSIVQTTGQFSVYNLGSGGTSVSPATAGFLLTDSSANTLNLYASTNTPLLFGTNNTERARIDSSGRLLVGTTTALDNGNTFKTGDGSTALNAYRATTTPNYGGFATYSDIGGTATVRSYIRSDGGLANYSANNVNLSDENLKKDISLAGNYLAKICAIPVKNFRYKDQSESEDITLGVIAQDVLAVAPELVSQEGFGPSEEKQSYLSVYQTDLQYALMKCIQEQQAIITSLTARIEALEA